MTAPIIPSYGQAKLLMSLLRGVGSEARGTLDDVMTALFSATPEELSRPASSRGGTRPAVASRGGYSPWSGGSPLPSEITDKPNAVYESQGQDVEDVFGEGVPTVTRKELRGAAGRTAARAATMLAGQAAGALLRRTILGALVPRALKVAPKTARVARDASGMKIPVRGGGAATPSPRQEAFDAFLDRILRHEDIPIDKGAFTRAANPRIEEGQPFLRTLLDSAASKGASRALSAAPKARTVSRELRHLVWDNPYEKAITNLTDEELVSAHKLLADRYAASTEGTLQNEVLHRDMLDAHNEIIHRFEPRTAEEKNLVTASRDVIEREIARHEEYLDAGLTAHDAQLARRYIAIGKQALRTRAANPR